MSTYRLKNLLMPRSVALVGASSRQGSVGRAILGNIRKANFQGQFGLVNPRHREIDGFATVARLDQLPFVPELVVITAPARAVAGIVDEAGRLGTAGALIITAGLGHGAGSMVEATEKAARKYGMRLVGPNCLGLMVPGAHLNASFSAHMPVEGNLALISQSGAIAAGMVDWAAQRAVGFSGIVSIGDQLDVDIADMLDYFALDTKTRAILLYIEAIKDARKFMSAARAAARIKPVVVVKSGRMAQGAKAAATHTGALAGSDAVYDAAFRRAGILRVSNLRELFDCAETLGRVAAPPGKRLAILTNGGGIGVLAVDRLVELGGIPAVIAPATRAKARCGAAAHMVRFESGRYRWRRRPRALCRGAGGLAGRCEQRRGFGDECPDRDRISRGNRRHRHRHRPASTANGSRVPPSRCWRSGSARTTRSATS